jgi:hypothetical protein
MLLKKARCRFRKKTRRALVTGKPCFKNTMATFENLKEERTQLGHGFNENPSKKQK